MKWLLNAHTCPGFEKSEVISRVERPPVIHHTEHMTVKIPERYALVNITDRVEQVVENSKVGDGYCLISAMHITAGIYINDAESGLLSDISQWIEKLAPFGKDYAHHQTGEDNGDAHLKSYLTNPSLTAPITRGKLDLGPWQQIFYAEFDGRRPKRILVKVMGIA
jgi:secondary thiamine-phosphate synthase enzyme